MSLESSLGGRTLGDSGIGSTTRFSPEWLSYDQLTSGQTGNSSRVSTPVIPKADSKGPPGAVYQVRVEINDVRADIPEEPPHELIPDINIDMAQARQPINPTNVGIPRSRGDPTDVEVLVSELNRQKRVNGWDDQTTRQYFYMSLIGPAQNWWEENEVALNEQTWEQIKSSFKDRFQPSPGTTAWTRFQKRSQAPGEDALSYFEEKNRLKKLTTIPIEELDAVQFFLEGLQTELRDKVELRGGNTDLQILRKNIKEIETQMRRGGRAGTAMGCDPQRYDKMEAMMLNIQQDIEGLRKVIHESPKTGVEQLLVATLTKLATSQNPSGTVEPTCYRCRGPGHYASACTVPDHALPKGNSKECYRCGDHGHYARECVNLGPTASSRNFRPTSRGPSRDRSAERPRSAPLTCQYCSGMSHTALACDKLKRDMMAAEKKN